MPKAQRLLLALTAVVAVITIGSHLSGSVEKIEIDKPKPSVSVNTRA